MNKELELAEQIDLMQRSAEKRQRTIDGLTDMLRGANEANRALTEEVRGLKAALRELEVSCSERNGAGRPLQSDHPARVTARKLAGVE